MIKIIIQYPLSKENGSDRAVKNLKLSNHLAISKLHGSCNIFSLRTEEKH